MKNSIFFIIYCVVLSSLGNIFAAERIKIAYINLNYVINNSITGEQSKKLLQSKVAQSERSLRSKEEKIQTLQAELQNSLLLTEDAKRAKQTELGRVGKEFEEERLKAGEALRQEERKYTENIFQEVKKLVETYAKKENYDLVVELAMYSTILYSKPNITDITDIIIKQYDKAQPSK